MHISYIPSIVISKLWSAKIYMWTRMLTLRDAKSSDMTTSTIYMSNTMGVKHMSLAYLLFKYLQSPPVSLFVMVSPVYFWLICLNKSFYPSGIFDPFYKTTTRASSNSVSFLPICIYLEKNSQFVNFKALQLCTWFGLSTISSFSNESYCRILRHSNYKLDIFDEF